jgi:hypothetical protein
MILLGKLPTGNGKFKINLHENLKKGVFISGIQLSDDYIGFASNFDSLIHISQTVNSGKFTHFVHERTQALS